MVKFTSFVWCLLAYAEQTTLTESITQEMAVQSISCFT